MRTMRVLSWILVCAGASVSIPLISGCEESVDPLVGTDLPYTVWGFMNAGSDTQFVRVFPIRDVLIPDVEVDIDARVFSTDLTSGEAQEWTYERVRFDSLIEGHVFYSPFRAEHEHRYRLEVVRSDGATTWTEVTVPSDVQFRIDVETNKSTFIPISILGKVPNIVGVRVTYHAVNIPPALAWPQGTPIAAPVQLPVTIVYDRALKQVSGGWDLEIDMARDFLAVREVYRLNCLVTSEGGSAPDLWLRDVEFSALAGDSSWAAPGGTFDPNVLSVPGTFSNMRNGYGFFGAGEGIQYRWTPDIETTMNAGYRFDAKCQGLFARPIPECMEPPVPCVGELVPNLWRIWLR